MASVCRGKERAIHEVCKWGLALRGARRPGSAGGHVSRKERRPEGSWELGEAEGSLWPIDQQWEGRAASPPKHHQSRSPRGPWPGLLGEECPAEGGRGGEPPAL